MKYLLPLLLILSACAKDDKKTTTQQAPACEYKSIQNNWVSKDDPTVSIDLSKWRLGVSQSVTNNNCTFNYKLEGDQCNGQIIMKSTDCPSENYILDYIIDKNGGMFCLDNQCAEYL